MNNVRTERLYSRPDPTGECLYDDDYLPPTPETEEAAEAWLTDMELDVAAAGLEWIDPDRRQVRASDGSRWEVDGRVMWATFGLRKVEFVYYKHGHREEIDLTTTAARVAAWRWLLGRE